jgi:predicted ATP-grasp superfamily ATP-dependent carboligase
MGRVGALTRAVAVFDIDLPPGVSFMRSLGRAGVPVRAYSADRKAAGRSSRFAGHVRPCPPVRRTDEFVAFLAEGLTDGSIDLVAPTSDYVCFAVAAAAAKVGIESSTIGHPPAERVLTALFKDRFQRAAERIGFPVPPWATPADADEALIAADEIGYPVVLKPRSHAGVGLRRGVVVGSRDVLASTFRPWPIRPGNDSVLAVEPDVALPLVQRYYELGTADVISVTGCLDGSGELTAVGYARKVSQSPRRLGVGTMFEPVAPPPFAAAAVDLVRSIQGSGIFELEVLVERATGVHVALDLNPRAFGQISLDIGRGNDLPLLWYNDVADASLGTRSCRRRSAELWHDAIGSYVGFAVRFVRGPRRVGIARHAWGRIVAPTVGAMHDWADPLPGFRFVADHLRHPRAFMRPFLVDSELQGTDGRPQVLEDPGHVPPP